MKAPIRVASVPSGHVYVRHLNLPGDGVESLPDPESPCPGWWPPAMLEPDWVAENRDRFDVFHIHFGYDGKQPDQLRRLCDELRRWGRPLVYTVHDLRNPHHRDPGIHSAQLALLMERVDRILTLTDAARRQIEERFGRVATVVPHPHVVPLERMGEDIPRRAKPYPTVGIHLKSLRANISGENAVRALTDPDSLDLLRLRVDIHNDAWEEGPPDLLELLRTSFEAGRIDLRIHDFFSDDRFFDYLRSLDIAVLPYSFGTHSGWLEACRDLGTAVVVPDCGCYSDQGRVFQFRLDADGTPSEPSLRSAVRRARDVVGRGDAERLSAPVREEQRRRIASVHRELYEEVLADRGGHLARPGNR